MDPQNLHAFLDNTRAQQPRPSPFEEMQDEQTEVFHRAIFTSSQVMLLSKAIFRLRRYVSFKLLLQKAAYILQIDRHILQKHSGLIPIVQTRTRRDEYYHYSKLRFLQKNDLIPYEDGLASSA